MNLQPYLDFTAELAEKSGDFIRPLFGRHDVEVELKSDQSPVTIADRGAEQLLRELIRKKFPTHGIIGEEYGRHNENAEWVWVLDPIDGTKSFASNVPLFGTLIALMHEGKPIIGAIHQPILRQLCIGTDDETRLNGQLVQMRKTDSLQNATLLTTDTTKIGKFHSQNGWDNLVAQTRMLRTWGDCYGYLLLADGWADIMGDPEMNVWDLMALIPIIRGAGGQISGWNGENAESADSCVAAHRDWHGKVLEILANENSLERGL